MNQSIRESTNDQSNTNAMKIKINLVSLIKITLGLISLSFLVVIFMNKYNTTNDFDVFEKQALPRNLGSQNDQIISSEIIQGQHMHNSILNQIINFAYKGNWTSLTQGENETFIGLNSNGEIDLKFMIGKDSISQEDVLIIIVKCLEGYYIDNWKLIYSYIPIDEIQISHHQNSIELKGIYSSMQGNRQIFKKIEADESKLIEYESTISMTVMKNSDGIIDSSQMDITYSSSSELNIESFLKISDNALLNEKVNFYLFLNSTAATLSMIVNFYLVKMLSQAESNIKSISLLSISINSIWDAYCCIINFSFALSHPTFFIQFIILTGFYFILFGVVDMNFFYYYWKINKKKVSMEQLQKSQYFFYFFYYLGLCIAFNFLYDFFFSSKHIILLPFLLWGPQIIHNIRVNNDITLPLVNTMFMTISRMLIPLYFKSISRNWLQISPDFNLFFNIGMITLFLILFMGLQAVLGARFFLPKSLRKKKDEKIYYYSLEELLKKVNPQLKNEDCVICLSKLFETDIPIKQDKDDIKINVPVYHFEKETKPETFTFIMSLAMGVLLDFHEWRFKSRKEKLPFMVTQCNHVFHSECLETWLRRMKKCPSCRKEVSIISV